MGNAKQLADAIKAAVAIIESSTGNSGKASMDLQRLWDSAKDMGIFTLLRVDQMVNGRKAA